MESIDYAVTRLTETHTVAMDGNEYECEALLAQLREARTSSVGAGSGGGAGDGGLINVAALSLWEQIDGVARAWMREFHRPHAGDLADVIRQLPRVVQAEHANGTITDTQREELDAMPAQWVAMIEDLFDPPHQKELTAPCPECGERYVTQEIVENGRVVETTRAAAVIIPVKRGRAIVAECRSCGAMWATETQLVGLAAAMGIEVDFVALREITTTV